MAYENLCMYCFEDMDGKTTCPHCGKDSRAAVPQIQMLPGSQIYHDRFLIGRALGQDATGIVYTALDTKKENRLRIREYLPRDCAERLNDGAVVPVAGMEDQFEAGLKKLRASVENVDDPRKRHFYFEENGTGYIAQRKSASATAEREPEEEEERGGKGRVLLFAGTAVAVLVVAAVLLITVFNGAVTSSKDITQSPTLDPSQVWIPVTTPTATPYVAPTFAALVDPELSWMDYTYDGDVEQEYQQAQRAAATPTPTPVPTVSSKDAQRYRLVNGDSSGNEIRTLQKQLYELGWLEKSQVTGNYDTATRQAIRDFQAYVNDHFKPREKLSVDGAAGPKTQQWLYEANAVKPTASPTPKVTPRPEDDTVDESSPASQVRRVQRQLIELGLLPENAADGTYGASTVAAVRRFQKRVNELAGYDVLEVTGKLDVQSLAFLDYYAEEWESLRKATAEPTEKPAPTRKPTPTPTTRPVEVLEGVINGESSRSEVRKVQQLLIDIGMLPGGSADGVYGSGTISAVADFQHWVNDQRQEDTLAVNGEVDQLTLLYLQYCKDHGMLPYGTPTPRPTKKPTPKPTMAPTPEPDELELDQGVELEQEIEVEPDADGNEEIELDQEPESGAISVGPRSDRESIRYVQEMLSTVGAMNANGVDGVYGKGTTRAVKRFQKWVNSVQGAGTVPEDGQVDDRTRQALEYAYEQGLSIAQAVEAPTEVPVEEEPVQEAPTAQPLVPDEGSEDLEIEQDITIDGESDPESIRYIQQMLNATGLLAGEDVTGAYDEATADAVRRFQTWVNSARGKKVLEVNGQMDDLTRQALEYAFEHKMRAEPEEQEVDNGLELEGELDVEPMEPDLAEEVPTQEPIGRVTDIAIAFGDEVSGGDVVSIPEGRVNVRWRADGDVASYAVYVTDGSGVSIVEQEGIRETGFTIDTQRMNPGEVYTLRLGALPQGGGESDIVWQTARFMLPLPEEPEIVETPEPEPEKQVGVVSEPEIAIDGTAAGNGPVAIETDSFEMRWRAEGDVATYYVRITDSDGRDIVEPQFTTQTAVTLRTINMTVGEVYTLSVGAVPVNGEREDMVVSQAQFMRPEAATPEPTEVPTPAPQVATIGTPVVTVGGSAYQKDGISYMTDSSLIISWNADGDVESYTIYVENEVGERQELGTTTDTSRTVNARALPAGIYTIYVGALPRGGGKNDVVWGTTHFAIPAPEVESEPEASREAEAPEGEPRTDDGASTTPVAVDGAAIGEISGDSDSEIIQQLQMRLYSLGLLSTDGLEPGVLDVQTLQAVAEFQQRVNDQYDAGLEIVDPKDPAAVVDAVTVSAIFAN